MLQRIPFLFAFPLCMVLPRVSFFSPSFRYPVILSVTYSTGMSGEFARRRTYLSAERSRAVWGSQTVTLRLTWIREKKMCLVSDLEHKTSTLKSEVLVRSCKNLRTHHFWFFLLSFYQRNHCNCLVKKYGLLEWSLEIGKKNVVHWLYFIYDVTLLYTLLAPYFSFGFDVVCNGSW